MTDQSSFDRFTMPGQIPDDTPLTLAGGAGGGTVSSCAASNTPSPNPSRKREGDGGYTASHPAGRGWVPSSRDVGIPVPRQARDDRKHESTGGSGRAPGSVWHDGVEHSFPHGIPEDPLAAIGHSEVFTMERRVKFLDHLAFTGNVRAAAARAGVSHETAYRKRRQDAKFAALWDAARVQARGYSESVLATRALDGIEVPVFHRGEIIAYVTKHDARLLLAHLARLDRQVEENPAAQARAGRFDELLADYAGHEAPEGFAEAAAEAVDWRERDTVLELPPTRDEYVIWWRSEEIDNGPAKTEAARMAAAAKAAGQRWDEWHEGAVALVEEILAGEERATPNPVKSVNPQGAAPSAPPPQPRSPARTAAPRAGR